MTSWMIYGANGFSGRLIAELAVERGMRPVLAGRSAPAVRSLAATLGLEARVFDLGDSAEIVRQLESVGAVLHTAGPFSTTWKAMVDACLLSRTHYLDITGEIDVFEGVFQRAREAIKAQVSLVPGVGFDVVPTDCLAAKLADRLPNASHLELAFHGTGGWSQGTLKTMVEGLKNGGRARLNGRIESVPGLWRTRRIPFPDGDREAVTIAWGDVSTAYHSTGIPNVCVYLAVPPSAIRAMRFVDGIRPVLSLSAVQSALKRAVEWTVTGPDASVRRQGRSVIWGEVRRGDGEEVCGALSLPESYSFTADASLSAVSRVLAGTVDAGAWTPSQAFGSSFVDGLDGIEIYGS